jgi:opacity protein-like surface antigen
MKKLLLGTLATLAFLVPAFAGTEIATGKDYKTPVELPSCFADQEFQIDIFGAYVDGNAREHAGPIRDHGWGGGIGLTYFFTRMLGLGADATWIYARENASVGENNERNFQNFTGSLILRFPSDATCLAPYLFAGGGFHTDGDKWASAHGGIGIEYRIVPHRVGIFADSRWTYFGDRYGHGDQNNFGARAGVRFVF